MKNLYFSLLILLLSACSGISENQCRMLIDENLKNEVLLNNAPVRYQYFINIGRVLLKESENPIEQHDLGQKEVRKVPFETTRGIMHYPEVQDFCSGCKFCISLYEKAGLITVEEIAKYGDGSIAVDIHLTPNGEKHCYNSTKTQAAIYAGYRNLALIKKIEMDQDKTIASCHMVYGFSELSDFVTALDLYKSGEPCYLSKQKESYLSNTYTFRKEDANWKISGQLWKTR